MSLNKLADQIIEEIDACTSDRQVHAVSQKYGKGFGEIQRGAPARAKHIINLASLKRKLFVYDESRAAERENEEQGDMFK